MIIKQDLTPEEQNRYMALVLLGLFESATIYNHQAWPALYLSSTNTKAWFSDYDNYLSGMERIRKFAYSLFVENR